MANNPDDVTSFLKKQVETFKEVRPAYSVLTNVLVKILSDIARELGVSAIVQARAKEISSFAEKAVRKRTEYPDPVNTFDDLCGGRVIATCKDNIEPVCQAIRRRFEIYGGEDVLQRLAVSEFGYLSVHFVVSLGQQQLSRMFKCLSDDEFAEMVGRFEHKDFDVGGKDARQWLSTYLSQRRVDGRVGPRFRAEIQVRSLLQHMWAELSHDRLYKTDFEVPRQWQRSANRIAATLEEADEDLANTIRCVDEYKTYYGAYMREDERRQELRKLEAVMVYDEANKKLALKIARLAMSLEVWQKARCVLKKFVTEWEKPCEEEKSEKVKHFKRIVSELLQEKDKDKLGELQKELAETHDSQTSHILMDYGWALWKTGDKKGRDYIRWAVGLDPGNVNARIFCAETYCDEHDNDSALEEYQKAFKIAPSEPQVLVGLLRCRILTERNVDFVPIARASLEAAIEKCRQRCRVRIYLPFAYYDIGLFSLLLNRPYDALSAYAKAVTVSDSDSQIERELRRVMEMKRVLKGELPELEWVRKFLLAAEAAKLVEMADDKKRELDSERALQKNLETKEAKETDEEKLRERQKDINRIQKGIQQAEEEMNTLRARVASAREKCQAECLLNSELVCGDRIVLVAGGCDVRYEAKIQEYRPLFEFAFKNFDGTVFCGCTNSGVNKLVGDVPDRGGAVQKLAYIPARIPSWTDKHPAFKRFLQTEGEGFSPIDTIQNWLDLLAPDIRPSDVKMLGINGGEIAAVEYRIALAMGAKVGILADSGRAASEIFNDEFWHDTPGLIRLPDDAEIVKDFVCGFPPCKALAGHRESIAREIHEEVYRPEAIRNAVKREPNLQHWEELPEGLRESNRHQVDHIEEKLRVIGRNVLYVGKEPIEPIEFSDEQVEKLAQMEHGRWTVERLLAGWRLGEKDVAKKKSPYLVAWSDLSDEIKKFDYDAVRNIPYRLAKWGYQIVPEKHGDSQTL